MLSLADGNKLFENGIASVKILNLISNFDGRIILIVLRALITKVEESQETSRARQKVTDFAMRWRNIIQKVKVPWVKI